MRTLLRAAICAALVSFCAANSPVNGVFYVSTTGSDSNDGLSWETAKLTLQAAVDEANTSGVVNVGAGSYVLTSTLVMHPGVRLFCPSSGVTITQGNGANLGSLIDFSSGSANGASIERCTVDGNSSNNTLEPPSQGTSLIYVGTANDISIRGNALNNATGNGVVVTNGHSFRIENNSFGTYMAYAIAVLATQVQTTGHGFIVGNTIISPRGQHAIGITWSDYNTVSDNKVFGFVQPGMTVNTSGQTITWVSGPNFSTLFSGQFIIINGGSEFLIQTVSSSTSLTVTSSAGSLSNVPAVAGTGDAIGIGASFTHVVRNLVVDVGSIGIGASNFAGGETAGKNVFAGNIVRHTAQSCISLEATPTNPFTQVVDNVIDGNSISNCGVGGAAVMAAEQNGIEFIDFGGGGLLLTSIAMNNYVRDDQASPTTVWPIGFTGLTSGSLQVGNNFSFGTVHSGVQ